MEEYKQNDQLSISDTIVTSDQITDQITDQTTDQLLITDFPINLISSRNQIQFIDLFCGIGGFHTGLNEYQCVLACDIDPDCRQTYFQNFNIKPFGDIFNLKTEDIPQHQVLCAGFPCQPFSSAGKQKGFSDDRSKTYFKLLEIIKDKRPNVIILENVKNLITLENGTIIQKIVSDLNLIDYNISFSLLNTSNFGLAQNRERLFIVGINNLWRNSTFSFTNLQNMRNHLFLKDIVSNLSNLYIQSDKYQLLPQEQWQKQKSGLIFCGYIKAELRKNGVLPNTEHLSRVHKQPNRIYHINGTHPTLSSSETGGRYYIYDGQGVRKLTINECYVLMGFDTHFIKHTKISKCYSQIGNSVSPIIIQYIKSELKLQDFL